MLPPYPYLDRAGFMRVASNVSLQQITLLAERRPGYLEHRIAFQTSKLVSRLLKRYRLSDFRNPPVFDPQGTLPPNVTLEGHPLVGSLEIAIQVTTPGALGTAVFQWTLDGGLTWTAGVATAPTVALSGTGLTALFPVGTYSADNFYKAASPVPAVVLGWLAALLVMDVWGAIGFVPQDSAMTEAIGRRDGAEADIKEAADSQEGLFELPLNDVANTSAVTNGPLSHSETSPFAWMNRQRARGRLEDGRGR